MKHEAQTVWDDPVFAQAWNDTYGIDMAKAPIRANLAFPLVAEAVGDFRGLNMADFGCGNGNLIRHFSCKPFNRFVGVDGGSAILATARTHTNDPRVAYRHQDLCKAFSFKARVDAITSIFVIEEIPTPKLGAYFANIARNLKAGGKAILFTQHPAYAMVEAHKAEAEGRENTKFKGHSGYFDTSPSTYALQLLNQRDGLPLMADHHHKPLHTILNCATRAGLSLTNIQETPSGVGTIADLRAHTPKVADYPRFLFMVFRA
ncbi:MAG: methyltransferase domain-containing protein [Alphaproteobacteria bacterium]|nr:methyltransferase domain-containing protein [Alphaproteobacteria bacterium]